MSRVPTRVSVRRKLASLSAASVAAWTVSLAWTLFPAIHGELTQGGGWPRIVDQVPILVAYFAIFGLPLSFVVTVVLGLVAWAVADRREANSWRAACFIGSVGGGLVAFATVAMTVGMDYSERLDRSSSFSFGDSGGAIVVDGVHTAHGWWSLLSELLQWPLAGLAAGLVAWLVANRGVPLGDEPV